MRREFGLLVSILLLCFFLISAGSLTASLGLIDTSELIGVGTALQLSLPTIQQSSQIAGEAASASYSWGLIAAMLASLFAIIFLLRKKRPAGDGSLWPLVGLLLGAGVYFGLVEVLSGIASLKSGNTQQELVLATSIVSLVALLVVASVLAALALLERSRAVRLSASLEGGSSIQSIRRLLESIRERVYSMSGGDVYRDSVIACYSAMTRLLARYGVGDRPSFTPRELETSASGRLDIGETDIHLLTRLFERARYADAPVTKREAQDSVDALERMTDKMVARIGSLGESVVLT